MQKLAYKSQKLAYKSQKLAYKSQKLAYETQKLSILERKKYKNAREKVGFTRELRQKSKKSELNTWSKRTNKGSIVHFSWRFVVKST